MGRAPGGPLRLCIFLTTSPACCHSHSELTTQPHLSEPRGLGVWVGVGMVAHLAPGCPLQMETWAPSLHLSVRSLVEPPVPTAAPPSSPSSSLQTAWSGCGCEFPLGGSACSFWHGSRASGRGEQEAVTGRAGEQACLSPGTPRTSAKVQFPQPLPWAHLPQLL